MNDCLTIEAERGYCSNDYQPFPDQLKFALSESLLADIRKARNLIEENDYIFAVQVKTNGLSYDLLKEEEADIRISLETVTVTSCSCWITLFEKYRGDTAEYDIYRLPDRSR